ncbi:hypothetical protein O181_004039 [Austropuccinia psidii MF-1]|uniref:HAT C-terminal dimerisation domain-containing protein n=1 Tax=Austropuccinia psidii MF-1 TaxID=1389203 RepID=A0A9Q3BF40_9BASI|nr:hypothetical protein [Austropuccinia psidii MF-1]
MPIGVSASRSALTHLCTCWFVLTEVSYIKGGSPVITSAQHFAHLQQGTRRSNFDAKPLPNLTTISTTMIFTEDMVNELDLIDRYLTRSPHYPATSALFPDQFGQYQEHYYSHQTNEMGSANGELDEYEDDSGNLELNQHSGHDYDPIHKPSKVIKRRRMLTPHGEWDQEKCNLRFIYKCRHCSIKIRIQGKNTSNLNKHRSTCCGRFSAWESRCPGAIDPMLGERLAAEESSNLLSDLVKALVAIQVSFSVFESHRFRSVLQRISPTFAWPHRQQIASIANQLYFEKKQELIDQVNRLPKDIMISAAVDCWTTKDQTQSYMATVIQWVNPLTYTFHKSLLSFDTMGGSHSGASLAWTLWESLSERGMIKRLYSITGDNAANNVSMISFLHRKFAGINVDWPKDTRFHRCACHVLNLVAKDFLANMGQLTDDDYEFFDNYLGVTLATLEESEDEDYPTLPSKNRNNQKAQRTPGPACSQRRPRALNQLTLETQDNSAELDLLNEAHSPDNDQVEPSWITQPTQADKPIVRQLRDLCSHIRGSTKQRESFIHERQKTRDPKTLPLAIPMTRWNYFLHQLRRAEELKLSIQLYTSTMNGAKYHLNEEAWSTMEFMKPILTLLEHSCNIFQSKSPTKHLVLPYYQVILLRLEHYAQVSPHTWRHACEAAKAKLQKYYDLEMENDDSLIATLLNPKYRKEIFNSLGVPSHRANTIISLLSRECYALQEERSRQCQPTIRMSSPEDPSESDEPDILRHLNQAPMESSQVFSASQEDEVLTYLQNLHPISKGEHIMDYWKRQFITGNFPNLAKIAFRYLSIPASSASVERVFSHSGKLKSPVRASLGTRTIAHLTCLKEWLNDEAMS